MTTAHRPTWAPAKGGAEQGGNRLYTASRAFSALDLPGHTKLKIRQPGQQTVEDVQKKDLRAELEERERKHLRSKDISFQDERQKDLLLLEASTETAGRGKPLVPKAIDADESDPGDSDDSDDDSDDEDDEAELLRELERIKKEREVEAAQKEAEEALQLEKERTEDLLRGNPLLNPLDANFTVKRRWDDDVVFKNQTRGEAKAQKRFINDTIRNDFHRRFLRRYIK